eukprot:g7746.t1
MDLFGSETSETLEREFTERGYESFVAKTQVKKGTNVRMKDYRAEMKSALQNMDIFKKMPKSYKRQVAATVSAFYQIPKEEGTWYDTDFVFKAGTKGKAHSIHIYFYRQANDFTRCDNFHYLIMGNTFDFKMADDIFLEWKKRDAAIKEADITFITATFQATALGVIESARLKNTELTCTTFKKPKKPWKPIKFDMMDDDEYIGNAWNRGWLRHYCAGGPGPGQMAEWLRYCKMAAGADEMEEEVDSESVGRMNDLKNLNGRGPGWDEMGDDEYIGNAWNRGWLRHYCAGGPGPGQMAEWLRYCKMAAGADEMEEKDESVGGWVKVAGGLIWKDIDRGVANGECNGRCQRRLRAASRSRRLKKKAYLNKMLISAVKNGNIRKVKRLLSQGAGVNAYVKDGENEDKKTALLTAIQYSPKGDVKVAMVKLLLKSGANPNKRSSKWRHSPLELSVWYDLFAETLKLLLAHPRTNPNLEDYQGKTALSLAISNGMQTHAVLIMQDPRTRMNGANKYGRTPLGGAYCAGGVSTEIASTIAYLKKYGATICTGCSLCP